MEEEVEEETTRRLRKTGRTKGKEPNVLEKPEVKEKPEKNRLKKKRRNNRRTRRVRKTGRAKGNGRAECARKTRGKREAGDLGKTD
ncbi:hypothetical protein NST14_04960 [Bacillus sp. FSL W8-0519]|uniref:hypothetical protein n=1 Tax=Bacillus sp. FSL W8-0519 TaxID=2954624 RepID=UPI0030FA32A0